MGSVSQAVVDHKNLIQTTSGNIASIGLDAAGKGSFGALVTPATWALNYATEGATPSAVDVGIYGAGFINAPAAIATGTVKAVVDDDLNRKLEIARSKEPAKYRPFIRLCYNYASSSPQINAMTIASKGGTAWKAKSDVWVYLTDARGLLVADYNPVSFIQVYKPKLPLVKGRNGRFNWEVTR